MSLEIALQLSELPISFCFRQRLHKGLSNLNQINRRGHVMLHYYALCVIAPQNSPRAHFMLHYYTLCETARLIGNDVRRRMFIIYVGLHRKPVLRTYIVSARGRRLSLSVFPLKRMRPEQATLVRRSGLIKSKRRQSFFFFLT